MKKAKAYVIWAGNFPVVFNYTENKRTRISLRHSNGYSVSLSTIVQGAEPHYFIDRLSAELVAETLSAETTIEETLIEF